MLGLSYFDIDRRELGNWQIRGRGHDEREDYAERAQRVKPSGAASTADSAGKLDTASQQLKTDRPT
jgi:hypothetical protein